MGLRDWERESGREREGKVKVCALVMLGWEGQRDGGMEEVKGRILHRIFNSALYGQKVE